MREATATKKKKRSIKWEKRRRRRRNEARRQAAEKNGTNCVISNYLVGWLVAVVIVIHSFVCLFWFHFGWLKFINIRCMSIPKVIKSSILHKWVEFIFGWCVRARNHHCFNVWDPVYWIYCPTKNKLCEFWQNTIRMTKSISLSLRVFDFITNRIEFRACT